MNLTFGDLKTRLMDRLGIREGDTRTVRVLESELNGAHDMVCCEGEYDWLEAGPTTVSVDGTSTTIAVPSTWRNVVHVELVSTGQPLWYRGQPIRAAQTSRSLYYRGRGTPQYWTSWGNSILTDPLPSAADSLRLFGILSTVTMVSDSDEPLVPADFRQIIVEEALANTASRLSVDVRVQARARDNAKRLWRAMRQFSGMAHPRFQYIQRIVGQT